MEKYQPKNKKQKVHVQVNKVEMQNNILHTMREASHVGEKTIFPYHFQPTSRALSGSNMSKKSFWGPN